MSDRAAVLVVPVAPAPDGNGLAMRAGMLLETMAAAGAVDVVIVPVSGGSQRAHEWLAARARHVIVVEPESPRTRGDVLALLGDPARRATLDARSGWPARARAAAPELASRATAALDARAMTPSVVVVFRSYLAPFGVTLARELGADRIVVDVDDDDERLLRAQGDAEEADAYARLADSWLTEVDLVVAASPHDAADLADRHGLTVATIPNAVRRPASVTGPPGHARVLYVGNLTYRPNVDAARDLIERVLPALRTEIADATVDLVGPHDDRISDLAACDGVRMTGRVPDVAPYYAGADVVVVPLREGAGTRIKVLEAFAFERPVVATRAAVAGLDVRDGESVALADDAKALAAQAARLLRAPDEARRLVAGASAVLSAHYLLDVVAPSARRLIFGAA